MQTLTIIGFGRFGQTLYRLLKDNFDVVIYARSGTKKIPAEYLTKDITITDQLKVAYASKIIFFAVPISSFEDVIAEHRVYFQPYHQLLDVLSVKLHPAHIFSKYLKDSSAQIILTHPMFGPDSSLEGFKGLSIVMHRFTASIEVYDYWKKYFTRKELYVIELTPDEHDKMAANSQGLTHFIGRLLDEYKLDTSPIDTLGAQKLLAIEQQTTSDSWQLFNDLQHYNPYTRSMRLKLGTAYDKVYNKLLPAQVNMSHLTIGIQGGKGSFNEEAILYWLSRSGITSFKIKYLYTTERVLSELHSGAIDQGLFAIHNSVGGIVGESVEAMAKFKFTIVEEFAIKISHALMMRDDAEYNDITTVMAHPQVFGQCKNTLSQKYPHLRLISGEGDLIDHAFVAQQLGAHKLDKNIATMGSKILAELYNLKVVEDNLQDAHDNYTSFLLVSR